MTTTTASTATREEIAAFAASVRIALADLPAEELDDLTDGLEADLAERTADADADSGDGALGDPVAYAEELRAAAGYPPRPARSHLGGTLPNLRTLPHEMLQRWEALRAEKPAVGAAVAFAISLRPVWWIARAWAAYYIVGAIAGGAYRGFTGIPSNGFAWLLLLGFVVLSVQFGRGRWLRREGARAVLLVSSGVLAIALPFLVAGAQQDASNLAYNTYYDDGSYAQPQGLVNGNGEQVSNIYAYDAQGNPLDQVQLYDQNGTPLSVAVRPNDLWLDASDGSMLVPNGDVPGRPGWNVFPLAHVNSYSDFEDDGKLDPSEISSATFPFTTVKSLANAAHEPEALTPQEMADGNVPTAGPTPTQTPAP
ncbi:hypothetical protein BH11ACT3_BH11ACT3_08980 [soil metagenome]